MKEPFYKDGLKFSCTQCSACCRFDPGYVFLSKNDIIRLADFLRISQEDFVDRYCRSIDIGGIHRLSLNEKKNYDCIFWENDGCTVYHARPLQCSSYPFWSAHLSSREDWDQLASSCPGVNRGRNFSKKEIENFLSLRLREPFL